MGNDSTLKISLPSLVLIAVLLSCKAHAFQELYLCNQVQKNLVKAKDDCSSKAIIHGVLQKSYVTDLKVSITIDSDYDTGIYFHTHTSLAG